MLNSSDSFIAILFHALYTFLSSQLGIVWLSKSKLKWGVKRLWSTSTPKTIIKKNKKSN